MNALQVYDEGRFDIMQRTAKAMVASGYFADSKDLAQAVVKVMAGAELGLPPFASMVGIHVIKGKPTLGANLLASLIKSSGKYNYRVMEHTDQVCRIAFYEGGEKIGESVFTAKDAQQAGVQNMGKFPKNMLFARAISNGARWHCPDIFSGAAVYTPDELGATVDESGDVVEGSYEPVEPMPEIIEPEPETAEAPTPMTPKTRKKLHATATELYGPAWDRKRAALCDHEGIESSNDLTEEQAQHYIDLFGKRLDKINGNPAEMLKHLTDLVGDKDVADKLLSEHDGELKDLLKTTNELYEDAQGKGGDAS